MGAIPLLGPAIGDTAGLTAITIAMTLSLAKLYGKEVAEGALFAFAAVVAGTVLGGMGAKLLASLLPGAGSAANAAITFGLHEATGWAFYRIFEEGKEPWNLSAAEIKAHIIKGKDIAEKEKDSYDEIIKNLPDDKRNEIEALQKSLGKKSLTNSEREEIMDKISTILEGYLEHQSA
jgi:uncharacterized protein (DUF697 family)